MISTRILAALLALAATCTHAADPGLIGDLTSATIALAAVRSRLPSVPSDAQMRSRLPSVPSDAQMRVFRQHIGYLRAARSAIDVGGYTSGTAELAHSMVMYRRLWEARD